MVENRDFFILQPAFDAAVRGGSRRNFAITFCTQKLELCGYQTVKTLRICLLVSTQYTNVTDGQTDTAP